MDCGRCGVYRCDLSECRKPFILSLTAVVALLAVGLFFSVAQKMVFDAGSTIQQTRITPFSGVNTTVYSIDGVVRLPWCSLPACIEISDAPFTPSCDGSFVWNASASAVAASYGGTVSYSSACANTNTAWAYHPPLNADTPNPPPDTASSGDHGAAVVWPLWAAFGVAGGVAILAAFAPRYELSGDADPQQHEIVMADVNRNQL